MKKLFPMIAIVLGAMLLLGFCSLLQGETPAWAANAATQTAHVAVQFAPGDQMVREITFTTPISGLLALQNSGLQVVTQDYGGGFIAVCSIEGVGCPASNCFCDTRFWSYEYWDGSAWQGYPVGASQSTVSDGGVEGWRWTEYGVGSLPPAPHLVAAQAALDWLAGQQSASTGGFGGDSASVEGLLAFSANHLPADELRRDPAALSLMGYWLGKGAPYAQKGVSEAGKLATGLAASQGCWPYGTQTPEDYYNPADGQYTADAGPQAWAMLGTAALGETVPLTATQQLASQQQADGGWEWTPGGWGGGTDTNTTALAIQALVAAGASPTATQVISGLNYLHAAQNSDGGFPYDPDSPWGTASDANSTAYVIQALRAAGIDPATWQMGSADPFSYLLAMQLPEGSFEWQAGYGANLVATAQAVPALLGRAYPFSASSLAGCPVSFLPLITK